MNSQNSIDFILNSSNKSIPNPFGQIINVYSKKSFLIDNDNNCDINEILPQIGLFPNVYETACITAISCSKTKKYLPFCSQVLSQNKKIQIDDFNKRILIIAVIIR